MGLPSAKNAIARWIGLAASTVAAIVAIACADARDPTRGMSPDLDLTARRSELEPVAIDGPGTLFMRPGRPIGAYDSLKLNRLDISFREAHDDERVFERIRKHVREQLMQSMAETHLPIVERPDRCTVLVEVGILDIVLLDPIADSGSNIHYTSSWGEATIVHRLYDGETLAPLMRFSARRRIPGGVTSGLTDGRDWVRIEATLNQLLKDTQSAFLEGLPIADTPPTKPGCHGGIYELRQRSG